jgi:hypothetical protein
MTLSCRSLGGFQMREENPDADDQTTVVDQPAAVGARRTAGAGCHFALFNAQPPRRCGATAGAAGEGGAWYVDDQSIALVNTGRHGYLGTLAAHGAKDKLMQPCRYRSAAANAVLAAGVIERGLGRCSIRSRPVNLSMGTTSDESKRTVLVWDSWPLKETFAKWR